MTKLLITGVSGLLGINLAEETYKTHEVTGIDRGKLVNAPYKTSKLDLFNNAEIEKMLDIVKPDWLINCAALADLDSCENNPELARSLNAEIPARLSNACKLRDISFAHISTDAVFDGEKDGAYTEQDKPNPLSIYAKTKFDGENAVLNENAKAIVVRVNFYGWSLGGKRSLAEFFFNNLMNNKSMSGFTDVIFCPMLVNHTARLLVKMLEKNLSGLYHLVGAQSMSKYQFGVELARKFSLPEREISPKSIHSSSLAARRSHNLSLSTNKLSTDLGEPLPDFSTGLDEFSLQFQQGYPHKIRSYQQQHP